MDEQQVTEPPHAAFVIGTSLVIVGSIGLACWAERSYRRWWKANHPFAAPKARIERMGLTYRNRRASMGEAAQALWELISEIDGALQRERT